MKAGLLKREVSSLCLNLQFTHYHPILFYFLMLDVVPGILAFENRGFSPRISWTDYVATKFSLVTWPVIEAVGTKGRKVERRTAAFSLVYKHPSVGIITVSF